MFRKVVASVPLQVCLWYSEAHFFQLVHSCTESSVCVWCAGPSQAGLASWDKPLTPTEPLRSQRTQPQASRSSQLLAESSWQNSQPAAEPPWQRPTGSNMAAASASLGDPFVGLPAPKPAPSSSQGGASDPVSLFSSLSTGMYY